MEKENPRISLSQQVGLKAERKLRAQKNAKQGVWFGLGMMGLIGWSVVVPTLLGAALGIWIDRQYADKYSWTLMLLILGLCLGCMNAWQWIANEDKAMKKDQGEKHV